MDPRAQLPQPIGALTQLGGVQLARFRGGAIDEIGKPDAAVDHHALIAKAQAVTGVHLPRREPRGEKRRPESVAGIGEGCVDRGRP